MIGEILLLVAGIFALLGAIGMFRFPDFYTRSHAATMTSVGGVMFALFILMFNCSLFDAYFFKTLIIIIIMVLTGPTAQHAIANKAYSTGVKPERLSVNRLEKNKGERK